MLLATTCKNFSDKVASVQSRALACWRKFFPQAQIVVFGECSGCHDLFTKIDARHVAEVGGGECKMPRFNAVADWILRNCPTELCVYLNADIFLPPDFENFAWKIPSRSALMIGQRVDLSEHAYFEPDDFYQQLAIALQGGQAEVHRPSGMDFFVFRPGMWRDLKPLLVGRGGYDSALVAYCLRKAIPVIDASFAFPVVHQWHDYAHLQGGKAQVHYGDEARTNFLNHGLRDFGPNCLDADFMMTRDGKIRLNARKSLLRRFEIEWYYRRNIRCVPNMNRLWNLMTRGGKYVNNPDWKTLAKRNDDPAGRGCLT